VKLLSFLGGAMLLALLVVPAATPAPGDHLVVTGPAGTVTAGDTFSITVEAQDATDTTITGYTGTVHFTSTDPQAVLPADYTFQPTDNGVHTFTNEFTLKTAGNQMITATDTSDGTITGFATVSVVHAGLDHFTLGSIGGQTAGVGFTVNATAEDQFENPLGSDYTGTPTLSGTLNGSPRGCNGGGVPTPGGTSPCAVTYANPPSVTAGVATWTGVTAFKAETGRTVTATDGGATGDSNTFTVQHAGLQHFTLGSITSPQTAGVGFTVTATAEDNFENPLGSDYTGTPTLSGNLNGSPSGCPGATNPCTVTYPSPTSVSGGVATWTNSVKGYKAETLRKVTVTDGGATGDSNTFTIQPNDPAMLTFTQQPNDAQPNPPTCSNPFVCTIATKVKDLDAYSNPEVTVAVNVQINDPLNNPGSDTLTALTAGECTAGVCTQNTDSSGVATFSDLTMHNIATNYKLKASSGPTVGTSPPATQISNFFNVANTVKTCNGNCTANASDAGAAATVTLTNVGSVSITLETQPAGTCSVIGQPTAEIVTVNPSGSTTGNVTVTGKYFHQNNAGGIGNYVLCKNSGPNTPYHQVFACSKKVPPPCYTKLSGNGMGDILFVIIVKQNTDGTFDPSMTGGGH